MIDSPSSSEQERCYWLAWSRIVGVGPITLARLEARFQTLSRAWAAPAAELANVQGIGPQTLRGITQFRQQVQPQTFLQDHAQANPLFWTPADASYPRLLREIPDRPAVVYGRGNVQPDEISGQTPVIAMVGTREPSEYGKRWARKLSVVLAQQGFVVISGLAEGIDTEAHHACLEAGGRTIAVLGTGVDVIYPVRNQALYERVLTQGWVMSEYPSGTQPDRVHFPRRNRLIAAMSRAVLVIEAPTKSGALITAHLANDYGRDVYVLPGSLDNPRSQGCLGLLSKGAQAILGEGHLLDLLGAIPSLTPPRSAASGQFLGQLPLAATLGATSGATSGAEILPLGQTALDTTKLAAPLLQILDSLADEAIYIDQIVQKVGLSAGEVSSALLELEIHGFVTQLPGMRYQRV